MLDLKDLTLIGLLLLVAEVFGLLLAARAIMRARSSQAAIAWSLSLIMMPLVAIPLFLLFGRSRFQGYVEALRQAESQVEEPAAAWRARMQAHQATLPDELAGIQALTKRLNGLSFTGGNRIELLVDGEATYGAMLEAIASARTYVLVQFYIVRDDGIGRRLRDALIDKVKSGVRVCFLYDEIGSVKLPDSYIEPMRQAGIEVSGFKTTRGRGNRFQINFRNHRKLLVVDGRVGFIGGLNLGDEYLKYRDTHVRLEGPAAQKIQVVFLQDWYWAVRAIPEVSDEIASATDDDGTAVGIVGTGPADTLNDCSAVYLTLAQTARERLWIASPYFVPDEIMVRALQAAALRGVDVRVLLPDKADQRFVEAASFTYYCDMLDFGVRLFRYQNRFMHQKIILVDDLVAGVGTVNLDNRSLYLNFEATALVADRDFAGRIAAMLENDFAHSVAVEVAHFTRRPLLFRIRARVARLASPLL